MAANVGWAIWQELFPVFLQWVETLPKFLESGKLFNIELPVLVFIQSVEDFSGGDWVAGELFSDFFAGDGSIAIDIEFAKEGNSSISGYTGNAGHGFTGNCAGDDVFYIAKVHLVFGLGSPADSFVGIGIGWVLGAVVKPCSKADGVATV